MAPDPSLSCIYMIQKYQYQQTHHVLVNNVILIIIFNVINRNCIVSITEYQILHMHMGYYLEGY